MWKATESGLGAALSWLAAESPLLRVAALPSLTIPICSRRVNLAWRTYSWLQRPHSSQCCLAPSWQEGAPQMVPEAIESCSCNLAR